MVFREPPATLYPSVLTHGDIRKSIEANPGATRKQTLVDWLETGLPIFFTGRVLAIDAAVADQ